MNQHYSENSRRENTATEVIAKCSSAVAGAIPGDKEQYVVECRSFDLRDLASGKYSAVYLSTDKGNFKIVATGEGQQGISVYNSQYSRANRKPVDSKYSSDLSNSTVLTERGNLAVTLFNKQVPNIKHIWATQDKEPEASVNVSTQEISSIFVAVMHDVEFSQRLSSEVNFEKIDRSQVATFLGVLNSQIWSNLLGKKPNVFRAEKQIARALDIHQALKDGTIERAETVMLSGFALSIKRLTRAEELPGSKLLKQLGFDPSKSGATKINSDSKFSQCIKIIDSLKDVDAIERNRIASDFSLNIARFFYDWANEQQYEAIEDNIESNLIIQVERYAQLAVDRLESDRTFPEYKTYLRDALEMLLYANYYLEGDKVATSRKIFDLFTTVQEGPKILAVENSDDARVLATAFMELTDFYNNKSRAIFDDNIKEIEKIRKELLEPFILFYQTNMQYFKEISQYLDECVRAVEAAFESQSLSTVKRINRLEKELAEVSSDSHHGEVVVETYVLLIKTLAEELALLHESRKLLGGLLSKDQVSADSILDKLHKSYDYNYSITFQEKLDQVFAVQTSASLEEAFNKAIKANADRIITCLHETLQLSTRIGIQAFSIKEIFQAAVVAYHAIGDSEKAEESLAIFRKLNRIYRH